MSSGHGGQVLVSAVTAALLGHAGLRDLGEHNFTGLDGPERVDQVGAGSFLPLRSLAAPCEPACGALGLRRPPPGAVRDRRPGPVGAAGDPHRRGRGRQDPPGRPDCGRTGGRVPGRGVAGGAGPLDRLGVGGRHGRLRAGGVRRGWGGLDRGGLPVPRPAASAGGPGQLRTRHRGRRGVGRPTPGRRAPGAGAGDQPRAPGHRRGVGVAGAVAVTRRRRRRVALFAERAAHAQPGFSLARSRHSGVGGGGVPPPGRHSPRHRAGRRPGQGALGRPDRRPPR